MEELRGPWMATAQDRGAPEKAGEEAGGQPESEAQTAEPPSSVAVPEGSDRARGFEAAETGAPLPDGHLGPAPSTHHELTSKKDGLPDDARPLPKGKSPWDLAVYGYLRIGFEHVQKDPRFDFVGRNSGFVLDSARVGLEGKNTDWNMLFRATVEGAADMIASPNTPLGSLDVRLRDAFIRYDPFSFLGLQVGQYKAPFQEEELRGVNDLMFASRAVGVVGVPVGRGLGTAGIALDRQLGLMLSPARPIPIGPLGLTYYVMLMNGNGPNQLLDDNGRLGFVARTEIGWERFVHVGAALARNDRTVGEPPNLYFEEDLGLTADLAVKVAGLEFLGAVTRLRTVFPTVGVSARAQTAFHLQGEYRFDLPWFSLAPGYRYAHFHPWSEGGDASTSSFRIDYHTFGLRLRHGKLPVSAWINYTLTGERAPRELDNDRFEVMTQLVF